MKGVNTNYNLLFFNVKEDYQVFDQPNSDLKVFVFDVDFYQAGRNGEKTTNVSIQAKTFKAALSMIEAFGRQLHTLNEGEYDAFIEHKYDKVFHMQYNENVTKTDYVQKKILGIIPHKEKVTYQYDEVTFLKPHHLDGISYHFFDNAFFERNNGRTVLAYDPATNQHNPQKRLGVSKEVPLTPQTLHQIDAYARNLQAKRPVSVELELKEETDKPETVELKLEPLNQGSAFDKDLIDFTDN